MRRAAVGFTAILLAACSEPPRESVLTVNEYLADDEKRTDQLEKCRENPGELALTANCRNAEEAEGKARLERMKRALGG